MGLKLYEDFNIENITLKSLDGFKEVLAYIDSEDYQDETESSNIEIFFHFNNSDIADNKMMSEEKKDSFYLDIKTSRSLKSEKQVPLAA